MNETAFRTFLLEKGRELYRDMPWRQDTRPYSILVSELMLQQTQVQRVIPKYEAFMSLFPTIRTLADAPLADVLRAWSGLGYNRRAKYLHETAKKVRDDYNGDMPTEYDKLLELPGIGPGTAGAIMAYAFNAPVVFVETNVRTVYFHHFFTLREKVRDIELVPLIEASLDKDHPREFYWALMDYGTWLKQHASTSRTSQSHHYKKQSVFKGSLREVRGQIIALLTESELPLAVLKERLSADERFEPALKGLLRDGLIGQKEGVFHLTA